jgi:hypothetical protein
VHLYHFLFKKTINIYLIKEYDIVIEEKSNHYRRSNAFIYNLEYLYSNLLLNNYFEILKYNIKIYYMICLEF